VTHLPEVKRPEHKADHPLRPNAEVKTRVAVHLPPLHAFTSVHLDRTLSLSISLSPSVYQALSRFISIFNFVFLSFLLTFFLSQSPYFCFFLSLIWTARWVQGLAYGLNILGSQGSAPGRGENSFQNSIQTGPRIHRTSYSMGDEGYFYRGKDDWSLKLTTRLHLVQK